VLSRRSRRASDRRPLPPADEGAAPRDEPLLVLRQSRWFARAPKRESIVVYADRIEHLRPGLVARTRMVTVRYEQVAQVRLDRRLIWCALAVGTTGGADFVMDGLRRAEADDAKARLDRLIADAQARVSVTDALERLGNLREKGLLTEFEFLAAKGAVFRNAA
jgi:hypothetical protein